MTVTLFGDWYAALAAICVGVLMPVAIRLRSVGYDRPGGVQKVHISATSRLGGVIVVVGSLAVLGTGRGLGYHDVAAALPLALAALPVVLMGLAEDLTGSVRPRYRMIAAVASGALASYYAGGVIPRLDLPLVDTLLRNPWIALPLTWFMVAGACNAINLVDGANGLASGTAMIMFGGIALAAGWSGDSRTLAEALTMMGLLAGFLVWNYPRGRIFLGDAGAYFVGFMYAELSIRLIARNDGISAWYVIMLGAYPICDTLFAMYRRGVVRRRPLMAPDALHLHTLVFRRVAMPIERRTANPDRVRANARVARRLWLHSLLCLAVAIVLHDVTPALWLGIAGYAFFYAHQYRLLIRFRRQREQPWSGVERRRSVKRSTAP
ncbi:MAG TPA: glycosyltransferase [Casimicrobiaceae bacterium]|nr:glycosyltransferase [Casimicrobiaceae bacterium]